jgi:3-oxoacyl-[acyl-carrier protein] reductase
VRTVLVTGGSRGLGLAVVRRLAASDYRVVALARSPSAALSAAADEAAARGGAIDFAACDLSDVERIGPFVKDLRRRHGPLHGLVNNAAIGLDGPLAITSDDRIEALLRINTLAPILISKYVVRGMMADGAGRIVNIASIIGFTGYSGLSVYAATKASMLGFTRSLAREVGRLGITVNAVAPGFLATDMTGAMNDDQLAQVARRSALKRLAGVDDVAEAVEFLLGDRASSITGTVMTVDAGATA